MKPLLDQIVTKKHMRMFFVNRAAQGRMSELMFQSGGVTGAEECLAHCVGKWAAWTVSSQFSSSYKQDGFDANGIQTCSCWGY